MMVIWKQKARQEKVPVWLNWQYVVFEMGFTLRLWSRTHCAPFFHETV